MIREALRARGHHNVAARHASTLEVTTDDWLTPAGDCIVGVEADRAPADFGEEFVDAATTADAVIVLTLEVGEMRVRITGRGDPALTYASERSMVCRTSTYVDDRTVLLEADTAAAGLDRSLVDRLQAGEELHAVLEVIPGEEAGVA